MACQESNPDVRRSGEAGIRQARDEDPIKFLSTLTREIANEQNGPGMRQMAALIFRNFILNKAKIQTYADFWVQLNAQLKSQMKQAFLGTLNSPEKNVRNAVANLIAAIASIELPRKEWDDLLPSLTLTSAH